MTIDSVVCRNGLFSVVFNDKDRQVYGREFFDHKTSKVIYQVTTSDMKPITKEQERSVKQALDFVKGEF